MESFLKLGLLNWYPIKPGESLLLLGASDWEENEFRRRGINVASANIESLLDTAASFDYIVVLNGDEFIWRGKDVGEGIKKMLKEKGHLLFACRNRLALRNFVGDKDPYTDVSYDGIENYYNYNEADFKEFSGRCYAKNEIEQFVKDLGFGAKQYRGYSVFPGLEMPQLFFAWDYLPRENMEARYTPLYSDASTIFLKETNVCDSLIQNGMFHQMSNAYILDCAMSGEFYEVNQVTTSMERGEENATATIVQKDGKVKKMALYPKANSRLQALVNHTNELKMRKISVVDIEVGKNGKCDGEELLCLEMNYIDAPLAMNYLHNLLYEDKELFISKTCELLDAVLASGREVQDEKSELGPIYDKVYYDLVPLNCFYVDGKYVFFDQEYKIEKYPINVILTRVLDLIYMGDRKSQGIVPMSYFLDKYQLTDKLATYRAMSTKYLQELKNSTLLQKFHAGHKATIDSIYRNRQKMNYGVDKYAELFLNYLKDIKGKKVYLFGSGLWARKFVAEYGEDIVVEALLDNNEKRWGNVVDGYRVINPFLLEKEDPSTYKVIICVKQYAAIAKQVERLGVKDYGIYDPDVEVQIGRCDENNRDISRINNGEINAEENQKKKQYAIGYVSGVFDLFHIGHLNLLRKAKEQCETLLVGVVSDEQASKGKPQGPYVNEVERKEIVESCKYVDKAFVLPIAAATARDVYKKYHFDVMFSGNDNEKDSFWIEEQAWLRERGSDVVFFPYTKSTSSTKLKQKMDI